ncbi:MAG: hypothetical protein KGI59_00590 [Patescibacteria group bacterium]|nr:hypothetical protein [Patescibacteria group bacterium]MDE2172411.1 hypothetical protein [Patescibacteria group bacterium]
MTSREYWKGRRIAVIGLGRQGEMVEDVKFLIKAGALVGIYDLKSEARLKQDLVFLRSQGLANYVCGSIPVDDLIDHDLVILSHEYPRDSGFLKIVREKGIPIEYPETLFFRHAPPITVVGIMGEAGTSTVVSMLTPILEAACDQAEGQRFFVVDPDTDNGTLAHLRKIQSGDVVLMRIIPDMIRELHAIRISPQVAVFTTIPPKGSFDRSPFEILEFQTYNNFIIASDTIIDATRRYKDLPRAKMLRTKASIIPTEWTLKHIPPEGRSHDREHAALSLQVARLFKVDDEITHYHLDRWKPLRGRIELVKKVKQIEFYNDSASVSARSTQVALETLMKADERKNITLIFGGAESMSDYRPLYALFPACIERVILVPGSGTIRERASIERFPKMAVHSAPSVEEAVRLAFEHAKKGDRVLFSPGFEARGYDGSRHERGERFIRAVRSL